jgi:cytochrome bd-type quinol oxidase subunit 2
MRSEVAEHDSKAFRTLVRLAGTAIATLVVAVLAGLTFLLLDPESGSATADALGITAAIAGVTTGVLAIAAMIYAQVKNLWNYVPIWIRWLVLILGVVAIVRTVANLIGQSL